MNQDNSEKPTIFPFKPDKVKESRMHIFEDDELDTEKQVNNLILLMFEYPEREFFLFHNTNIQLSPKLKSAEEQNIILLNEVECFYYKHPKYKKDYVKISGNNLQFEWEKELIKKGPEYHKFTLKLTQKAKRDLEISYKKFKEKQIIENPLELKPNFLGFGIDLIKLFKIIIRPFRNIRLFKKKPQ